MLTGYDSKWVNTLYVDKLMRYVDIIQSFSRTNRLFGPDKPHGIIKYYCFPYTMEQNIEDALEVYVDRPLGVFVDKLEQNLDSINRYFLHIGDIFRSQRIENFATLPTTREDRNMFAKDFVKLSRLLEAAKLQGFLWEQTRYEFEHGDTHTYVEVLLDEATYRTLLQRYREMFNSQPGPSGPREFDYPIETYLTETGTGTIDAEYINSKFVRFVKNLYMNGPVSELTKEALKELHNTFASLSQRDQRTAMVILHNIESGDLLLETGKSIQDYIAEYQQRELHKQVVVLAEATGVNASQLEHIMERDVSEQNINEYNQFENLKLTLNLEKTKLFLEKVEGAEIHPRMVAPRADRMLRDFILDGAKRTAILRAYLGADEDAPQEMGIDTTPDTVFDAELIKQKVGELLEQTIPGLLPNMRSMEEILNSVLYVINTRSIDALDGVALFVKQALGNLFCRRATVVDKHVAFNQLVSKYEAYLKKLYYLIHDEVLQARNEGEQPTWKDALHGHGCLWELKYSTDETKQQLYQWLLLVKGWRNDETHLSPVATEQEVDTALNIILTLYFYVTGASITDLEMNGHTMEFEEQGAVARLVDIPIQQDECTEQSLPMAAESGVSDLHEEQRIDIFKKSLISILGYHPQRSIFTKQRHWESIYRIAADYGFVKEGDYAAFKRYINMMELPYIPHDFTETVLARLDSGVYQRPLAVWSDEGLDARKRLVYNDIKACAEAFETIVKGNISKRSSE